MQKRTLKSLSDWSIATILVLAAIVAWNLTSKAIMPQVAHATQPPGCGE